MRASVGGCMVNWHLRAPRIVQSGKSADRVFTVSYRQTGNIACMLRD